MTTETQFPSAIDLATAIAHVATPYSNADLAVIVEAIEEALDGQCAMIASEVDMGAESLRVDLRQFAAARRAAARLAEVLSFIAR